MTNIFEEKLLDFKRKGDQEKVRFLEKLDNIIQKSQKKRIQANDKTILDEVIIPKWVPWEILYSWATREKGVKGKRCVFCSEVHELGVNLKEKFVCHDCFFELKSL